MDSLIETLSSMKMVDLKAYARESNMKGFSKHTTKEALRSFIIASSDIVQESSSSDVVQESSSLEISLLVQPNHNKRSNVNVLDLFSGCGGMIHGFSQRFNVVCGIDVWDKAIESYNSNYEHLGVCEDLTSYPPEKCNSDHVNGKTIDIIVGGPPCQSYSMGGRRDPNDPRANLFMEYYRYLQFFKPKVFIMENVIGILSVKDTDNNLLITRIMELLSENYNCMINKLYACDFEVPQLRRRVIVVGIRKDLNILPQPIASINPNNRIAVGTILQDRQDVDPSHFLSERAINGIIAKKERMRNESKGFGAQFLDLAKPSYTIPARYWKDGYDALVRYSDREIRRLTVLELKRIQTFPDDYIFCGTKKDQIMQIGNAVACKFGYHLANYVAGIFDEIERST